MITFKKTLLAGIVAVAFATQARAADDPSIPKGDKAKIQEAMSQHIKQLTNASGFPVFDHTVGRLVRVKLDSLHAGVAKKGSVYASCADFVAADGTKFDVDFLVQPEGTSFEVVSSLVHAKNGTKSPYDVEH